MGRIKKNRVQLTDDELKYLKKYRKKKVYVQLLQHAVIYYSL